MPLTTSTLNKKYNQNIQQVYKKKTTNPWIRGFIVLERLDSLCLLLYIVFIFSMGQLDYVLSRFLIAFYRLLKGCKGNNASLLPAIPISSSCFLILLYVTSKDKRVSKAFLDQFFSSSYARRFSSF